MKRVYFLLLLLLLPYVFAYVGCPGSSQVKIAARADDEYWLSFVNRNNVPYNVPFAQVSGGTLRYGRDTTRDFITQEVSGFDALLTGPTPEDAFNINRKDTFLVTGGGVVGSSHVLEYESVDVANKVVVFQDLASGPKVVNFMPASDLDPNLVLGQFDLAVGGSTFRGFISSDPSYSLSLDLDGNGGLNGDTSQIIVRGGGILDIGSNEGGAAGSILASLTTPARNFRDSKGDESLEFTVSTRNGQVSVSGIRYDRNGVLRTPTSIPPFDLYQDGASNNRYGATDYGMLIQYYKPSTAPEELIMDYPGLGPCAIQLSKPEPPKPIVQEPQVIRPPIQPPQVIQPPVIQSPVVEEPVEEKPTEKEPSISTVPEEKSEEPEVTTEESVKQSKSIWRRFLDWFSSLFG
ncbi:MAG TPA: hypothetical protein VJG90_06750 [Candidatus Nanoarchaeia archaeon]|nr:hypothetical protein [Candidatus Nanoarchaeia archaeon]